MQKIKSIKSRGELILIEDTSHHVRVFGIEAIPELLIQYDQEISSFTKAYAEALEEISRLKKELKNYQNV